MHGSREREKRGDQRVLCAGDFYEDNRGKCGVWDRHTTKRKREIYNNKSVCFVCAYKNYRDDGNVAAGMDIRHRYVPLEKK
jgi:hypothetical protein